jgi:hypothetical protein
MLKVVRVSLIEFELEDGQIYGIDPPLEKEMSPSEFQEHYDSAVEIVESLRPPRGDDADSSDLGCNGKNTNNP